MTQGREGVLGGDLVVGLVVWEEEGVGLAGGQAKGLLGVLHQAGTGVAHDAETGPDHAEATRIGLYPLNGHAYTIDVHRGFSGLASK